MTDDVSQLSTGRKIAIWFLVIAASLISIVSILTLWVQRQVLDNHAWTTASEQLIEDPQIRDALSVYLVNQLYAEVDVAAALRERLPPQTAPLAGPAAAALREPAVRTVGLVLQRPRVQQLWINTSSRAHARLVNVLENKTGNGITTGNGVVTLDVSTLVRQVGAEIGLPAAALDRIPPNAGEVVLMSSTQLSYAQKGVRLLHALSAWLLVLVLGMYAAAVYLARGRRRETLRTIAWAFVVVGLLALIARKLLGNYVVDAITSPAYRGTGHRVWLIATSILGQIGWASVLYGVVALIGTTLAGPTALAVRARRAAAPVLNEHQGFVWAGAGLVFLLVVLWGPTHALRTWWGIALIGGLLALGIVALRRQILAEPAAPPAAVPQPRPVERVATATTVEEIVRLSELHDAGSITDDEFVRAKEIALT
jgi:hypothetical protein